MIEKMLIPLLVAGILAICGLLATDHYGFAIKASNYLYPALLIFVSFKLLNHAKED